jgi:hypothetical protein
MRTIGRFVIGFVIGCVLFFWSFILAGVGHGSSVPFASAAPFFFLNRDAFVHVGMLGFLFEWGGIGLLWGIYFGVFPLSSSFIIRRLLLGLVVVFHVGMAVRELVHDSLLRDSFVRFPLLTVGYFVFFLVVLVSLGVVIWRGSSRLFLPASS